MREKVARDAGDADAVSRNEHRRKVKAESDHRRAMREEAATAAGDTDADARYEKSCRSYPAKNERCWPPGCEEEAVSH